MNLRILASVWTKMALAMVLLACAGGGQAQTLTPNVQKGANWLGGQIQNDGSLSAENASIATPFQAREETQVTLSALSTAPGALVSAVAADTNTNTEYTARRILAAGANAQAADIAALLALQNADGGWGLSANYQSGVLDTALVLQALAAAHSTATSAAAHALSWLASSRANEGGWSTNEQNSVYVTGNVLLAASAWSSQDTGGVASAAATWLLGARVVAKDFGDTLDDAVGLLALATQSAQSAALSPLVAALNSAQLADGSWADDPYLTALALRAVWMASLPAPAPTTAAVTGTVIDQSTGQPLVGVAVGLVENAGFKTTTNATGGFQINGIPAGSYTLQAALAGYQTASVNIATVAGQTLAVGILGLSPIPTTANLSGTVKNNTGKALQNVLVAAGNQSTLTDANGNYLLTGIAPGAANVTAALSGYQTASANVAFSAGVTYLFSPTLYPTSVTPPATTLQGIVIDGGTGNPIAGASAVLKGVTQVTDANGRFAFASVTAGAFSLTVSAAGYQAAVVSGSLVTGLNDLGNVALQPAPAATTVQGHVYNDQDAAIAGAAIVADGGPSATSGSDGGYRLADLPGTQWNLRISATGYVTQTFSVAVSAPGSYTQDFHLLARQANAMTLGPLTVAPQTVGANAVVSVTSALINGGSGEFDGILLLVVRDAANEVVSTVPLTDANGFSIGAITMQPGETLGVIGHWNSAQFAPGAYQFELRLVEPESVWRATPLGVLIVDQFGTVTIAPTLHFSGTVAGDPPLVQAGLNQSIHITAVEKNDGNVTLPAQTFTLKVTDAAGQVAYTATAQTQDEDTNVMANLDFGSWTPTTGGNYRMTVAASDPALGGIAGTLYAGNVAQASFTANPDSVVAGTRTVHGNIHVTGVNPAQATVTDPLAPLITASIQKAVTYNDTAASTWINGNRCSGCHIGNQALVGGEMTRDLTTYNAFNRTILLNNVSLNQASDGGLTAGYSGSYWRRLTALNLWGLLGYHNLLEFPTVIKHAADWVVGSQASNGDWSSDYNNAWFDTDISMAMLNISNLSHADSFFKTNAITTVPVYTASALLTAQPASSRGFMTVASSGNIYYTDQSGASVNLVTPDGTLLTRWTGLNDPRTAIELGDGQVWVSTGGGTYRLNPDGTATLLAPGNMNTLSVGLDGTTVWGTIWGDKTIYQLDASGNATAWLSNGPFSSYVEYIVPDTDGSLYVTDYSASTIYRILPDKTVTPMVQVLQGNQSPPGAFHLLKDGDHWLLSTTNGIYRFSSAWEGQRIYWGGRVDQMARLADGTILFVGYNQPGIRKLVPGTENVAPSLPQYEAAIDRGTAWLQAQSLSATDTLHLAQQLWGLGEAYRFYQTADTARAASLQTAMNALAAQLRANQNADGGWGRNKGNVSDALVTAQTGIALDYTDPSPADPVVRKAVAWLLTQQQGDGSWVSANGIMATHESTTTMVAIWLPTILERLGSIDAQVTVAFPPDSQPANLRPAPGQTVTDDAGNTVHTWKLQGVTNAGRDLDFDLILPDLQPGEARPVAASAYMTFDNSFTQQAINVPIAIPQVTARPPVSLAVVTDQLAYPANATAQVTTTLTNLDHVQIAGTLRVDVYDAGGNFVGAVVRQDVALPADGALPVSAPFAIGTIVPAQYTVKAVLSDGATVLATGHTEFNVLPDGTSASATTTLATDRPSYRPSDRVQILSRAQNLSANAVLTNLTLSVQVVDAGGAERFAHAYPIAQLLPGAMQNFSVAQVLDGAPPGVYTVKQDLFDNRRSALHHVETAYSVVSTAATGFGLTGTLAATPRSVRPGEKIDLTAAATNRGNAALTDLPLTIYLIDPEGNLAERFDQTSTLAVNASVPFGAKWNARGRHGATYLAVLVASVGQGADATPMILAQDSFQIYDLDGAAATVPVPLEPWGFAILVLSLTVLTYRAHQQRKNKRGTP